MVHLCMLMILSPHKILLLVTVNIAELHVSIVKKQVIKRSFRGLKRYRSTMLYHGKINFESFAKLSYKSSKVSGAISKNEVL